MYRQIVFFCVAVAVVSMLAVGGVSAQDDGGGIELNGSNVTVDDETTYAQELDSETRIVTWEYDDDRDGFVIVFEADRSKRVTITEAVQFSEGSGSGRIYQERLPEGTTEVFVSVPRRAGQAAVTMTTALSIQEQRYSYVSTGQADIDKPPITYQRAQLLVLLSAIGASGAAFGIVRKRRNDEEADYERVL